MEEKSYKYFSLDAIREALEDARVVEAGDMMMGACCKILVFSDNEQANRFEEQLKLLLGEK